METFQRGKCSHCLEFFQFSSGLFQLKRWRWKEEEQEEEQEEEEKGQKKTIMVEVEPRGISDRYVENLGVSWHSF